MATVIWWGYIKLLQNPGFKHLLVDNLSIMVQKRNSCSSRNIMIDEHPYFSLL